MLFVVFERRHHDALVPMHLFASRTFSVANVLTLLVYGALGSMLFFLVLQLQVVTGWSPLKAGLATIPLTLVMLVLSVAVGRARRTDRPTAAADGRAGAVRDRDAGAARRGRRTPATSPGCCRGCWSSPPGWCCWWRR